MSQRIRLIFLFIGCILILCSLLMVAREARRRSALTQATARLVSYLSIDQIGKVRPRVVLDVHGEPTELSCVAADTAFVQTHIGEDVTVYVYNMSHPDPSRWNIYLDTGKAGDLPGIAHVALPAGIFAFAAFVLLLNSFLIH